MNKSISVVSSDHKGGTLEADVILTTPEKLN
jgi:hypothetical protein